MREKEKKNLKSMEFKAYSNRKPQVNKNTKIDKFSKLKKIYSKGNINIIPIVFNELAPLIFAYLCWFIFQPFPVAGPSFINFRNIMIILYMSNFIIGILYTFFKVHDLIDYFSIFNLSYSFNTEEFLRYRAKLLNLPVKLMFSYSFRLFLFSILGLAISILQNFVPTIFSKTIIFYFFFIFTILTIFSYYL